MRWYFYDPHRTNKIYCQKPCQKFSNQIFIINNYECLKQGIDLNNDRIVTKNTQETFFVKNVSIVLPLILESDGTTYKNTQCIR